MIPNLCKKCSPSPPARYDCSTWIHHRIIEHADSRPEGSAQASSDAAIEGCTESKWHEARTWLQTESRAAQAARVCLRWVTHSESALKYRRRKIGDVGRMVKERFLSTNSMTRENVANTFKTIKRTCNNYTTPMKHKCKRIQKHVQQKHKKRVYLKSTNF